MKYLIIVLGPTASGKTTLSIRLAQYFQTEILSSDSRQFYKEMNIGTAKPTQEEQASAPHHFIDSLSIREDYNVGQYERDGIDLLEKLFQKHDVVVMAGGSGLYIKAICEGLDNFPDIPKEIRETLNKIYQEEGLSVLQEELKKSDETYYHQVDLNNPQRVIRALEVCRTTGGTYSQYRQASKTDRSFKTIKVAIDWERAVLYDRINRRVDIMLEEGLEAEAKKLYEYRHLNSLQTVGYQELFDYFSGEITKEEAIRLVKRNSRRYAKRQLTWFRKEADIHSFKPEDIENNFEEVILKIKEVMNN